MKNLTLNSSKRLIINLIARPGSGKGTQGRMLSEIYGVPHISIGDLFRDELRNKTAIGKFINHHDAVDPYNLFPDELYSGVMSKRLAKNDCEYGFILDGFPQTIEQALVLKNCVLRPKDIHVPLYMDINEKIIIHRLKNRFICPSCGLQSCGHERNTGYCLKPSCNKMTLRQRLEDINEEKLTWRFRIFNENKEGTLKVLSERDKVNYLQLSGNEFPEDVFKIISAIINEHIDSKPNSSFQKNTS